MNQVQKYRRNKAAKKILKPQFKKYLLSGNN